MIQIKINATASKWAANLTLITICLMLSNGARDIPITEPRDFSPCRYINISATSKLSELYERLQWRNFAKGDFMNEKDKVHAALDRIFTHSVSRKGL
jgi:hypothetical protein